MLLQYLKNQQSDIDGCSIRVTDCSDLAPSTVKVERLQYSSPLLGLYTPMIGYMQNLWKKLSVFFKKWFLNILIKQLYIKPSCYEISHSQTMQVIHIVSRPIITYKLCDNPILKPKFVTEPAKTGHVGTYYTLSHYRL